MDHSPDRAGQRWRSVIATLANPDARELLARIVLDSDVNAYLDGHSPSRRRHIVDMAVRAGLIDDATSLQLNDAVFRELLAENPARKKVGIERFLADGRIAVYPAKPEERAELLCWIAEQAVGEGEVLTEQEINDRLARYTSEIAVLRRYLVDFEFIERTPTGSAYARVSAQPPE